MPLSVKWPFPDPVTPRWRTQSKLVVAGVGVMAKVLFRWLNHVRVYNLDTLHHAVATRPPHTPLITVSNHQSCLDDPMMWGSLKWRHLVTDNQKVMRWAVAAADITFTREIHARFFSLGRVVPIVRGEGVYQRGMTFVLGKLNQGAWVHTFPEGGINVDLPDKRIKWGVGRLIAECNSCPIVLPIWHLGCDSILPNHPPYIPRVGKHVTVVIGEPIDFTDMLRSLREQQKSPMEMRKALTDVIQQEFTLLRQKTEGLHFTQSLKNS